MVSKISRIRTSAFLGLFVIMMLAFQVFICMADTPEFSTEWPYEMKFGEPKYGGILKTSDRMEPKSLNPMHVLDFQALGLWSQVGDKLIYINEFTGDIYPGLAWKWESSADAKIFTFYLHPDAKWHDGEEFSSEDVVWNYETVIEKEYWQYTLIDGPNIKSVTAPDDLTVVFELYETNSIFFSQLAHGRAPVIMPKHLFDEDIWGPIEDNPNNNDPIGTGAFKFVRWERGTFIECDANLDYHWGRPYIDKHIKYFITSQAIDIAALEAGEIIAMDQNPPIAEWKRLGEDPNLELNVKRRMIPIWVGFNLNLPPWDDVNVRKAFCMLIPQDEISERVYLGYSPPAYGTYMTLSWAYNPNAKQPTYDPETALQMLDDAGLTPGPDGIRIKVTIDDSITLGFKETNEFLKEHLKQFGIDVKVSSIEWGSFADKILIRRDFEVVLVGGMHGPDPDDFSKFLVTGGPRNSMSYSNARVDELFDMGRRTTDLELRKEYYWEIQEILADELPRFNIVEYAWAFIHNAEWRGFLGDAEVEGYTSPKGHLGDLRNVWYEGPVDEEPEPEPNGEEPEPGPDPDLIALAEKVTQLESQITSLESEISSLDTKISEIPTSTLNRGICRP